MSKPVELRVGIVGLGAVGARLARQLVSDPGVAQVVLRDPRRSHLDLVVESLGPKTVIDNGTDNAPLDADVVVIAAHNGDHAALATVALRAGQNVVSTTDNIDDVRALLSLDAEARERDVSVVVGAGFAPGLSCLLAAQAARSFDSIDEIHVAKVGTGGPACAREHHRALSRSALDWREGAFVRRPGGSGRELCWFPDPIGAVDCYRAALPDALLLVPAFPGVRRVTARVAATRRDRLTMRLPMLWPTHPEGGPGAVRVEVRGQRGETRDVVVFGAMDRAAVASGAVAAVAAKRIAQAAVVRRGAGGLAELFPPGEVLTELRQRGVRVALFQGSLAPNATDDDDSVGPSRSPLQPTG